MNVAIISFFRNSAARGQVQRYFQQLHALRSAAPATMRFRLIAVEGDSADNTQAELLAYARGLGLLNEGFDLVSRSHGKREWGSTEEHERMEALSWVGNGGLERVRPSDDYVIYVESDLIWRPETMLRTLTMLQKTSNDKPIFDVFGIMPFAADAFYDIYAFRHLDGTRFGPFAPYSRDFVLDGINEVSSVGSCLVMRAEVARNVRIPGAEVLVGFCRIAREQGYRIWVDARERIQHPC